MKPNERNTMTFKTTASRIGNGLLDGLSAIHDATIQHEIDQLDTELDMLRKQMTEVQKKKDELESER
jgi:hypothetical protein